MFATRVFCPRALVLVGCLLAGDVCQAAEQASLSTPQPVTLHFTTGRKYRGILLSANDKQVRFRLRADAAPAVYQVSQIRLIQTATDTFRFNSKTRNWQSTSAQTPRRPSRTTATSPAGQTATVIAEGVGEDKEDALCDAFRAAIRQVVGTLVDAHTLVKNDQVISDKVLSYSDGVIRSYRTLTEQKKKSLWRVKVSAVVVRRSVATRLKEAGVTVKVEGKDLVAEVLTNKEARASATDLMQKAFADFPRVLVAEATKPAASDYDEDRQELSLALTIHADRKRYQAFIRRVVSVLDRLSLSKTSVLVAAKLERVAPPAQTGNSVTAGAARTEPRAGFLTQKLPAEDSKSWFVWIMTGADARATRLRWNGYRVDGKRASSLSGLVGKWSVRVALLDSEGKVITQEDLALGGSRPTWGRPKFAHFVSSLDWLIHEPDPVKVTEASHVLLAPLWMGVAKGQYSYTMRAYQPTVTFKTSQAVACKIRASQKELKRLKTIRCTVLFSPSRDGK